MLAQSDKPKASSDLLRQILLDHLQGSRAVGWPGADGLTADDIVNYYPQAIQDGDVPGWDELERRFAELAGELQTLRSAKGWLDTALSPAASGQRAQTESR